VRRGGANDRQDDEKDRSEHPGPDARTQGRAAQDGAEQRKIAEEEKRRAEHGVALEVLFEAHAAERDGEQGEEDLRGEQQRRQKQARGAFSGLLGRGRDGDAMGNPRCKEKCADPRHGGEREHLRDFTPADA
jgi:hypothetical protein